MKPTKNHRFCVDCMRPKMLFTSEKKALRCIEMNGDEIFDQSGSRPIRAYYCMACGGWHITSKKLNPNLHSAVEHYFMKRDALNLAINKLKKLLPGDNLEKALKTKVGILYQMVMRKKIIKSQCEEMIQLLIDIFEMIIKAKLVSSIVRKSFNHFYHLCSVFQNKVTKGKFEIEPKTLNVYSQCK